VLSRDPPVVGVRDATLGVWTLMNLHR